MAKVDSVGTGRTPPDGAWVGYYLYRPGGQPHCQSMTLSFAIGQLLGDGEDDIGRFTIAGSYCVESGIVTWAKTYLGAHTVEYKGYHERGAIWGAWRIGAEGSGGFKIWPMTSDGSRLTTRENIDLVASAFGEVLTRYAETHGITLQEALNEALRQAKDAERDVLWGGLPDRYDPDRDDSHPMRNWGIR